MINFEIEQFPDPERWAARFWIDSRTARTDENNKLICYQWCVDHFGEPFHSFSPDLDPDKSWAIVQGMSNTYIHFKDANQAMMFKLRWWEPNV